MDTAMMLSVLFLFLAGPTFFLVLMSRFHRARVEREIEESIERRKREALRVELARANRERRLWESALSVMEPTDDVNLLTDNIPPTLFMRTADEWEEDVKKYWVSLDDREVIEGEWKVYRFDN